MKCTNCGNEFVGNFCMTCGAKAPENNEMIKCPICGADLKYGAVFCGNCGTKLEYPAPAQQVDAIDQGQQEFASQPIQQSMCYSYMQPEQQATPTQPEQQLSNYPSMQQQQQNIPTPKKKMSGGKIAIMVIGIVLGVILLIVLLAVGCNSCVDSVNKSMSSATVAAKQDNAAETELYGGNTINNDVESTTNNAFDEKAVNSKIAVKEYTYKSTLAQYLVLVLTNNSSCDCDITVDVDFKDSSGNLVGTKSQTLEAFSKGTSSVLDFLNEETFASYEYKIKTEKTNYTCTTQDLDCEVSTTSNKAIVSVTNNGKNPAEFVEYKALFFNGDNLVYVGWGYCVDSNNKIEPGATEKAEADSFGVDFTSVTVYLSSRGDYNYNW